jgi:TetR/AcrR family transcriptional regulator, transcriptional repressor for nem operon
MTTAEDGIKERHESKTRLLQAALRVIRSRGYTATRIEDVCEAAGVTKGSFFHHFKSKEELALESAAYWEETTGNLFLTAAYHRLPTARERLLGYVELRKALLKGELPDFTCLVGTMVQEVYRTQPAIRQACAQSIGSHAQTLETDIAEAVRDCGAHGGWTAASLALHTQAVVQGAFILAKATSSTEVAAESLNHLRRYLELLFPLPAQSEQAA